MTDEPRLTKFKDMVARFPDDARARYFLAHELFRVEAWEEAAEQYDAYVRLETGDTGAALRNLGMCHDRLGRKEAAATAYRLAIERALEHAHEGLASEIRQLLDALDD